MANIARHTIDLAENVVENEIFPKILYRLKDNDALVKNLLLHVSEKLLNNHKN